jgi:excisionase family DNA binding protein
MGDVSFARRELLTVEEVAWYLKVGSATVYRWCREGRMPCLKIGKYWRTRREELEELVGGNGPW